MPDGAPLAPAGITKPQPPMAEVIATVARLRRVFPKAFSPDHPPLRIGIHEEIRARMPDIPGKVIHAGLRLWTYHEYYKLGVACQFRRVGLDGKPVGDRPTPAMAWHAVCHLVRLYHRDPGTFDPRQLHPLALWSRTTRQRVAQSGKAETLAGDDLHRGLRLLSNHPDVREKIALGITGIVVQPANGGIFCIRRKDGAEDPFSVAKCLGPGPPRTQPPCQPKPGLQAV
jgi:hypothetical protein